MNFTEPETDHERFLYAVSHDLQEPLRMVSSFLRLLNEKSAPVLDQDSKRYLDYSMAQAERMKGMIQALVDLSRVGRTSEPDEACNLGELLNDIAAMYQMGCEAKAIEIHQESLPLAMMAPSLALRLVRELFFNSVQHGAHEPPLRLRLSGQKLAGNWVEFVFADNGKGMPPGFVPQAMEMFSKSCRDRAGLGAGLAIAKAIVQKHGGEIRLSSEEGKGTVVSFTLPSNG
jgi:signal transduction histidine kinase